MKYYFTTFLSFIFLTAALHAQKRFEQKALADANQMALSYNQKDFTKYVDYMLPSQYGYDTANKKGLAKMFSQIGDTSKFEVVKLLKLNLFKGEQQAVFLHRSGQRTGYIFGIFNANNNQWYFSQAMSRDLQFDMVLTMAPSFDTAFAAIIDPRYGKRINFELNRTIPAFHFTDINGNTLSSKDLAGKVLVFNFWGITCPPCIKEIPHLNALVESMKGKDVVFIAPAFYSPKEYLLEKFLPKYPFAYNIVNITNPDDYSMLAFPTHVVTDKNHTIVYKVASGSPDTVRELETVIQNALTK